MRQPLPRPATATSTGVSTPCRPRATDAFERARRTRPTPPRRGPSRGDRVRARHHRGGEPGGLRALRGPVSGPGTRSSSPAWSTTPTSSHGRWSAPSGARGWCRFRSPIGASSSSTSTSGCSVPAPGWWRRCTSPTPSARSTRSAEMVSLAHARGIPVLLDGAQAVPHLAVDVAGLGCDFYVFSGHKVYGPSGIGALYGRYDLLAAMPPYQGGGDMIRSVTFERTELRRAAPPLRGRHPQHRGGDRPRRRARLPRADSACDAIAAHEHELLERATAGARGDPRGPPDRHRRRQGRGGVLRHGRRPPPRRRHHPRPRGGRGARRPPLRPAGDGPLRRPGHRPRLVRPLQHRRGGRRPGARARARRGRSSARCPSCATSTRKSSSTTTSGRATSGVLDCANHHADGRNPLCGDHVKVYLADRRTAGSRRSASRAAAAPSAPPPPR